MQFFIVLQYDIVSAFNELLQNLHFLGALPYCRLSQSSSTCPIPVSRLSHPCISPVPSLYPPPPGNPSRTTPSLSLGEQFDDNNSLQSLAISAYLKAEKRRGGHYLSLFAGGLTGQCHYDILSLNENSINEMDRKMGRNKEQNQKIREGRRCQILSVALRLFSTKGLSATKISDISSASGFSQGLIYHYFSSKEEIFVEIIRTAFEKLNHACTYLESLQMPVSDKITMAITKLLQGLEEKEDAAYYHMIVSQAAVSDAIPEEARVIIENEYRKPYEVMARIMRQGQKEGTIRNHDPEDLAAAFWTSIKGVAISRAAHGEKFRMPDPQILIHMFIEGS